MSWFDKIKRFGHNFYSLGKHNLNRLSNFGSKAVHFMRRPEVQSIIQNLDSIINKNSVDKDGKQIRKNVLKQGYDKIIGLNRNIANASHFVNDPSKFIFGNQKNHKKAQQTIERKKKETTRGGTFVDGITPNPNGKGSRGNYFPEKDPRYELQPGNASDKYPELALF